MEQFAYGGSAEEPPTAAGTTALPDDTATVRYAVLIVEDDFFVALELLHSFEEAGFDVIGSAATAEEALELAKAKPPDLAIMDIRLAGPRDGIEVATLLRRSFGIPSIFASAHADAGTRHRAEAAAPLGWVEKPYHPASVVELARKLLR